MGFAGGPVTVSADLSEVWVSSEAFDEVLDVGYLEELPEPEYNLNVGSGSHAYQTGRIMEGVENVIQRERCGLVLVEGDTNTVLAGSLAAVKLRVAVGHVEAGLRSYDRSMPEEINRVVSDHLSDLLFAPTETSRSNLLREGIPDDKIFVTGNTVVDAVHQNLELAKEKKAPLAERGLEPGEHFLVTAHRAENTDDPGRLQGILDGLQMVSREYGFPVVFPIHPRTRKMIGADSHRVGDTMIIDPVGYLEFLLLEASARLILTDSGGVQEEACIHRVPCVTLRDKTPSAPRPWRSAPTSWWEPAPQPSSKESGRCWRRSRTG